MEQARVPIFDTFVLHQCGVCGCWYGVPWAKYEATQRLGGYLYCPSGHGWGQKEGNPNFKMPKPQSQMVTIVSRHDWLAMAEETERTVVTKPTITRRRKTYKCPYCGEMFKHLGTHIRMKHGEIKEEGK